MAASKSTGKPPRSGEEGPPAPVVGGSKCRLETFFNDLPDDTRNQICKASVRQTYPKKHFLYRQGAECPGVYYINTGRVKLFYSDDSGKSTIVDIVSNGDIVGLVPVLADDRSLLSAEAMESSDVYFTDKAVVLELLGTFPALAQKLVRHLASDLKNKVGFLVGHLQKSVRERVAEALLKFHEKCESPLSMRREDLASWAGTSMESAVRCLSDFKREGVIRTSGREIFILKPEELSKIARRR